MKIIARLWKKFLFLIITGSTTLFVAACYGMPASFNVLGNWTVKVRDQNEAPIPGLQVTISQYVGDAATPTKRTIETTDALGSIATVLIGDDQNATYRHEALIQDLDGEANGGTFPDTEVVRDGEEETIVQLHAVQ